MCARWRNGDVSQTKQNILCVAEVYGRNVTNAHQRWSKRPRRDTQLVTVPTAPGNEDDVAGAGEEPVVPHRNDDAGDDNDDGSVVQDAVNSQPAPANVQAQLAEPDPTPRRQRGVITTKLLDNAVGLITATTTQTTLTDSGDHGRVAAQPQHAAGR